MSDNNQPTTDYASLFATSPSEDNKIDALVLAARFLEIINDAMEEKKMSRKSLAHAIGTSPSWITQLFRGDRIPNLEILSLMAKTLDITFEVRSSRNHPIDHFESKSLISTFQKLAANKKKVGDTNKQVKI